MISAKLQRSTRAHKKYQVSVFQSRDTLRPEDQWGPPIKIIHFGDPEYEDFTQHGDVQRKMNYAARHSSNGRSRTAAVNRGKENWFDPLTAGFWARWLLWEKPSMEEAKKNITKMFGIKFI